MSGIVSRGLVLIDMLCALVMLALFLALLLQFQPRVLGLLNRGERRYMRRAAEEDWSGLELERADCSGQPWHQSFERRACRKGEDSRPVWFLLEGACGAAAEAR